MVMELKKKKLTIKENKKLFGMKVTDKFELYSELKQIKEDFSYFSYLEENLFEIDNKHDKNSASKLNKE